MDEMRFVEGDVWVEFEEDESGERLAQILSASTRGQIDEWISHQKARGNADDTDPIMLKLLAQICRRLDDIEQLIKNGGKPEQIAKNGVLVSQVGYEGLCFSEPVLRAGVRYFARLKLPVFMGREILMHFVAKDERAARFERLNPGAESEWSAWVASCERAAIRRQREG